MKSIRTFFIMGLIEDLIFMVSANGLLGIFKAIKFLHVKSSVFPSLV